MDKDKLADEQARKCYDEDEEDEEQRWEDLSHDFVIGIGILFGDAVIVRPYPLQGNPNHRYNLKDEDHNDHFVSQPLPGEQSTESRFGPIKAVDKGIRIFRPHGQIERPHHDETHYGRQQ